MVETLLRTTALYDAHRNHHRGRLCRPRVPSKVQDEVEHPAVDGRHGVPELPRWNETPPAFGHDCRRLDTVSMKMHDANGKGINILGAAILRLSGKSPNGEPRETRQITYITDNSDKLFLSREACIALGIITTRFPTVG